MKRQRRRKPVYRSAYERRLELFEALGIIEPDEFAKLRGIYQSLGELAEHSAHVDGYRPSGSDRQFLLDTRVQMLSLVNDAVRLGARALAAFGKSW